jgi:tRNA A-37 threonylcarbamoyl transferase component Bud32
LGRRTSLASAAFAVMTDRWDRVTELFGAARMLDGPGRAAFLDAACAGDPDLRLQIDQLLADDVDDGFMVRPQVPRLRDIVAAAVPLAPGDVLSDRYVVEELLGSGGQGIVYRAADRLLARAVVLKVMRASGRQSDVLRKRFEQERRALLRVDHPGVVGILDVGELSDGSPFLVIEFINGVSLREVLRGGPLDRGRVLTILHALAASLSAAHAAGVAHQDLKPENIMLQPLGDGTEAVRLIDFGIAKIDRSELEPGITAVLVAGTVRYMAPEQFEGENTSACDIYALALIACEMLSGQPDPRALPASVGRAARHLIDTALAFRPGNRPADVRQWASRLDAALRARRYHPLAAAAVLLAIGIAGGVAGTRALDTRRNPVERIVQKAGALDPVTEGFLTHDNPVGTVYGDAAHTRLQGWRVTGMSVAGTYYYHPLSEAQQRLAAERGWKLDAVMRAEEGVAFVILDFGQFGPRFDLIVYATPPRVRLQTQLVPDFLGLDYHPTWPQESGHHYELTYSPVLRTAKLWVDGELRLTDYPGHTQFKENRGLELGVAPFDSTRGVGLFDSVRLEINP